MVPAAAVTTHAKPHAQQQPERDLEVERAAMGQLCRPQRFGEVQRGNPPASGVVVIDVMILCLSKTRMTRVVDPPTRIQDFPSTCDACHDRAKWQHFGRNISD